MKVCVCVREKERVCIRVRSRRSSLRLQPYLDIDVVHVQLLLALYLSHSLSFSLSLSPSLSLSVILSLFWEEVQREAGDVDRAEASLPHSSFYPHIPSFHNLVQQKLLQQCVLCKSTQPALTFDPWGFTCHL